MPRESNCFAPSFGFNRWPARGRPAIPSRMTAPTGLSLFGFVQFAGISQIGGYVHSRSQKHHDHRIVADLPAIMIWKSVNHPFKKVVSWWRNIAWIAKVRFAVRMSRSSLPHRLNECRDVSRRFPVPGHCQPVEPLNNKPN
jgi:hypothetical protein